MSSPARPDETAEPDSGITHGAIPTHIATERWAYIGKMPPKPRKLAATSGPGKPAGGATTRQSAATATPGAASSKTSRLASLRLRRYLAAAVIRSRRRFHICAPRPLLTAFLHKSLWRLRSRPQSQLIGRVRGTHSACGGSDTQQPTPVRDSSSGMVEAAKVRVMMERIRTQVVERNRLMEAIRISSESTLTTIDEFLADIPEL
ncbi:hypothetical protein EDB85DRAFT_1903088 [Lactarius pseudohatsudake]|nr:hypothetical protein EDB85DRAFT_1903088 [Lactarius pseudohatsudake]